MLTVANADASDAIAWVVGLCWTEQQAVEPARRVVMAVEIEIEIGTRFDAAADGDD